MLNYIENHNKKFRPEMIPKIFFFMLAFLFAFVVIVAFHFSFRAAPTAKWSKTYCVPLNAVHTNY